MLLGGLPAAHGCTGWSAPRCSPGGGTVKEHRAQDRRNVWVGVTPALPGPKGVNVGIPLRAGSLRCTCENYAMIG